MFCDMFKDRVWFISNEAFGKIFMEKQILKYNLYR